MKIYKWDADVILWLIVIVPFIFLSWVIYDMASDSRERKEQVFYHRTKAPFKPGDLVRMKAFGHIGMVVDVPCRRSGCTYSVRFSAITSDTNTKIFGADGPIDVAPVSVVRGIREYELEKVK